MTIGADALIDFFGTQAAIDDGSTSSIADGAFSVAADITTRTNGDDAPSSSYILQCQFATLPDDNSTIDLFARKLNIESTNDSPEPDAVNLSQRVGSFTVDGTIAVTNDMFLPTNWLTLPNMKSSQEYDYYLGNNTGQTISANWELFENPSTKGPHP